VIVPTYREDDVTSPTQRDLDAEWVRGFAAGQRHATVIAAIILIVVVGVLLGLTTFLLVRG
jgi:hypothetical protein